MTRIRTATLAAKVAAAALAAALATAGLAAAGTISLPGLPDQASENAKAVHGAIDGSEPAGERCSFGLGVAGTAAGDKGNRPEAGDACDRENLDALAQRGKDNSARGRGNNNGNGSSAQGEVGTQQQGGASAGQEFGQSVSSRATGESEGGPRDIGGRAFGEAVSGEAKELGPPATPQGGRETGESASQHGQQTSGNASQGGRDTAQNAPGGPPGGSPPGR